MAAQNHQTDPLKQLKSFFLLISKPHNMLLEVALYILHIYCVKAWSESVVPHFSQQRAI